MKIRVEDKEFLIEEHTAPDSLNPKGTVTTYRVNIDGQDYDLNCCMTSAVEDLAEQTNLTKDDLKKIICVEIAGEIFLLRNKVSYTEVLADDVLFERMKNLNENMRFI
jgi:hypothetical protein